MLKVYNMNIQKILDEFDEKYIDYIKPISVGQYNDNGVNIGFIEANEFIKAFLKQSLEKQDADFEKEKEILIMNILDNQDNENEIAEQARKQGVESVVLPKRIMAIKGSCEIEEYEYANGRNDTIRTIEQLKAKLLKE